MGRLQVYNERYAGDPVEFEATLGQLRKLCLEPEPVTKRELELLYVRKVAHAAKMEGAAGYQRQVEQRLTPGMSVDEQIRLHQEYWQKTLGVADVTKVPDYRPEPQFDRGWVPETGLRDEPGGWPYWTR